MDNDTSANLTTYNSLVSAFAEFLTVAIHLILYEREIYPRESFLRTRKYDFPAQQNRHPRVCKWITDAVEAVETQLLKCTVRQTSVVLYSKGFVPIERYVFSTDQFPIIRQTDIHVPFASDNVSADSRTSPHESRATSPSPDGSSGMDQLASKMDLTHQFAGVLSRLSTQSMLLRPLPKNCSFTLALELRDASADKLPRDDCVNWLPAEPGRHSSRRQSSNSYTSPRTGPNEAPSTEQPVQGKRQGSDYPNHTIPVRAVESGPFVLEVWIERSNLADSAEGKQGNEATKLAGHKSAAKQASVKDAGN